MPANPEYDAQNAAETLIRELKGGHLEKVGWPEILAEAAHYDTVKTKMMTQEKFAEKVTQHVVRLAG